RGARQDVALLPQDGESLLAHPQTPLGGLDRAEAPSVNPREQPLMEHPAHGGERILPSFPAHPASSRSAEARRPKARPTRLRDGNSSPRSCASRTRRSNGRTQRAGLPKTRSTSLRAIKPRAARLTTNSTFPPNH